MMTLTILSENTVRGEGLLAEHGLSYWIDTGTHRVLFDTGQGMVLARNADKLGIDLGLADAIVLSHGHYDHVLGLPTVLEAAPEASLWFHPAATEPKFSRSPQGKARRISSDFMEKADFGAGRIVRRVTEPTEVVPGVWVTGTIPRTNDFEDVGGPFFLDESLEVPDPIADDMALYLPRPEGLSVIFGCAHSGAINTLNHVLRQTGPCPLHTLIGGLHLLAASEDRIERTIRLLTTLAPRRLGFCHCTGTAASRKLWAAFPDVCTEVHVGKTLGFSPSVA